jgi:hypothetical protein
MKNNLVFSWIKEDAIENPEDTELILLNFMISGKKLAQNLAVNVLTFERVHRIRDIPASFYFC